MTQPTDAQLEKARTIVDYIPPPDEPTPTFGRNRDDGQDEYERGQLILRIAAALAEASTPTDTDEAVETEQG